MIRVAAVADIHFAPDAVGTYRPLLDGVEERADVLLVAGDLTRVGTRSEAVSLAEELDAVPIPIVAVLGNHDYHAGEVDDVVKELEGAGVRILEGDTWTIDVGERTLGVAGIKGFGGGFAGACGSDFGEPEMKAFVGHTRAAAERLEEALRSLDTDVRIALIHYAPVPDTLAGERLEIYPFLGSYLLGEAVDRAGADLVLHGHAHAGVEQGGTLSGIQVRNVALPVIGRPYTIYCFGDGDGCEGTEIGPRETAGAARSI